MVPIDTLSKNLAHQCTILGKVFADDGGLKEVEIRDETLRELKRVDIEVVSPTWEFSKFAKTEHVAELVHELYAWLKVGIERRVLKELESLKSASVVARGRHELYGYSSFHNNGKNFHYKTKIRLRVILPWPTT